MMECQDRDFILTSVVIGQTLLSHHQDRLSASEKSIARLREGIKIEDLMRLWNESHFMRRRAEVHRIP
jgi:hypothetical protein